MLEAAAPLMSRSSSRAGFEVQRAQILSSYHSHLFSSSNLSSKDRIEVTQADVGLQTLVTTVVLNGEEEARLTIAKKEGIKDPKVYCRLLENGCSRENEKRDIAGSGRPFNTLSFYTSDKSLALRYLF